MRWATLLALVALVAACNLENPKPAMPRNLTGVVGAASYEIDVPAQWNGTLFLYSHGYAAPGTGNPAQSAPAAAGRAWLLDHHFAAAGSAYASTGWAVEDALKDQMALLDLFGREVGKPKRVIAWGHSLGGLITAGLVELHPDRFAAAMPMCGVLAGGVATWNIELDSAYAFKTLLAPLSALELVNITTAQANRDLAQEIFLAAEMTPQGRARLALVAGLIDIPGWFDPRQPEPASTDYAAQAAAQRSWESLIDFNFAFRYRLELEQRAGGNPSWNTGVDYRSLLATSPDRAEVTALYTAAGLDLQKDLRTLNSGPKIEADPRATEYLERNISFDGDLEVPVLSVHTTGDGLVTPSHEEAFSKAVAEAGKGQLLRQLFVHRAGHCTFSAAETIAAVQALLRRLDSGRWDDGALTPAALNASALAQGSSASQVFGFDLAPSFTSFTPAPFPRPHPKGAPVPA
jgi:pimeloyl-ACP methyl ester carboxylesterase